MAVLVIETLPGMDLAAYDQASSVLAARITKQPGFLMHFAHASADGLTVGEVWESRSAYEKWFADEVAPNVPGADQIGTEIIELHRVVRP